MTTTPDREIDLVDSYHDWEEAGLAPHDTNASRQFYRI
jgi:hypothetical protein